MISAIGNDEDGKTIIDYSKKNNLETAGIIISEENETGSTSTFKRKRICNL